jgi:hypothetical protein
VPGWTATQPATQNLAMTESVTESVTDHRGLAVAYFGRAWDLIDAAERTPEQDRDLLAAAFASRQHWVDAGGTAQNLAVSDWQVAHAASLAGLADTALLFARAAVERSESDDLPLWMQASGHEGLARAHAAAGDRSSYEREAARARELLAQVDDTEDRDLISSQLASIPVPD